MEGASSVKWISSNGGPLILLPTSRAGKWGGASPERVSVGPPRSTDYQRACETDQYLGIITIGDLEVLVFGNEPMQTAWIPSGQAHGGMFIRWEHAENESSIIDCASRVIDSEFHSNGLVFEATEESFYLIDAAIPGSDLDRERAFVVSLRPARYMLETATCRKDRIAAVIHRLRSE